jgi:hypothetical protein
MASAASIANPAVMAPSIAVPSRLRQADRYISLSLILISNG